MSVLEFKGQSAPDNIRILKHKSFDASLMAMWRTGGQKKKKAEKVLAVLGRLGIEHGATVFDDLQVTDHGESRIKGCVKYELGGGCRWITIQTDKMIALCYVGDHDDCDHWLNQHSGMVITKSNGILQPVYRSEIGANATLLVRDPVPSSRPLIESLQEDFVNELLSSVPPKTILKISALRGVTIAPEIESICVEIPNPEKQSFGLHPVPKTPS